MAEKPEASVRLETWPGLASNQYVDPKYAREQDNAESQMVGALSVRAGLKPVTYSSEPNSAANNIIAMYHFQTPAADFVVYEDASGNIRAGKNPT